MRKASVLCLLLVVGTLLCSLPDASAARTRRRIRVRKSVFNLTPAEFAMYVEGISTMYSVATGPGQMLYGPKYREMDYFVIKHATSAFTPVSMLDPNTTDCYSPAKGSPFATAGTCDVAHDGPWFITFHTAFLLEFEQALLSVVPELKALPYWEMYEEFKGTAASPGKYYTANNTNAAATKVALLTPERAGSLPGNPDDDWMVKDGIFRNRLVPKFSYDICVARGYKICQYYNGSIAGYLRDIKCNQTQPHIMRFPASALSILPSRAYLAPGLELNYTKADFARCADTSVVKNVWDFMLCIDAFTVQVSGYAAANATYYAQLNSHISTYTHALFHNVIGSYKPGTSDPGTGNPFGFLGDARTTSTSPNESFLFFPFHNNMLRSWMIWQRKIVRVNPKANDKDVLYGYPKVAQTTAPIMRQGTALDDVVSPLMPFTSIFEGIPAKGATHRHILEWVPDYTYDNMEL